ncbi:MAG: carbon monoxide dehydrogenase subunit G, partial [Anaerolineales bacterium]|nr:carbon monoxide dehydrogenase subunit G [Anaerolineales bacterium]
MKLEGEYVFNGSQEEVWELVRDPEVLATALPGTQSLDQVGENEYEGEMNVRIGPVAGVFSGKIIVSDEVPPESCTLTVDGKGKPGFANGVGHVNLIPQEDGTTLMKYEGDVQIGGRLASVGQRLLDTTSKSMIRQGLETLNQALEARVATETGGEQVEYTPPSESEFATAVAKDMAGEMFSSSKVIWIAVAVLIVIILVAV